LGGGCLIIQQRQLGNGTGRYFCKDIFFVCVLSLVLDTIAEGLMNPRPLSPSDGRSGELGVSMPLAGFA
jgi:hypothetical protein